MLCNKRRDAKRETGFGIAGKGTKEERNDKQRLQMLYVIDALARREKEQKSGSNEVHIQERKMACLSQVPGAPCSMHIHTGHGLSRTDRSTSPLMQVELGDSRRTPVAWSKATQ